MFDGAGEATLSTVATEPLAQSQAEVLSSAEDVTADDALPDPAPTGEPQFSLSDQALFDALAAYDTSAARQEIVFLSPSVRDYHKLLDGISPNVEVFVLDPARDGVEQMAEVLAGRTGIDAVHLIAEGNEAQLHLGTSFLTQDSISTHYAQQFQQIGQSLSEKADLLIYGCNFGQGEAGLGAMKTLAELTGADIAASTGRGSLVASFLVSMPAWRHFDPLPVLGGELLTRRNRDRKMREDDEQEKRQFRGLDRVLKSSDHGTNSQKRNP
jgi:hypothetical protein